MTEKFFEQEKGLLLVISGPSGAGKGTLCKSLMSKMDNIHISISATTREPRFGEIDGKNYYFIKKEQFEEMIKEDEFMEYAQVYDNYYGTPQKTVFDKINQGVDVILEIDIQGASQVREKYPEGIYIFVVPPSMKELKKRITERGTENKEQLEKRLNCAYDEIRNATKYSYIIVNDEIEKAANEIRSIIVSEKCRSERLKNKIEEILGR